MDTKKGLRCPTSFLRIDFLKLNLISHHLATKMSSCKWEAIGLGCLGLVETPGLALQPRLASASPSCLPPPRLWDLQSCAPPWLFCHCRARKQSSVAVEGGRAKLECKALHVLLSPRCVEPSVQRPKAAPKLMSSSGGVHGNGWRFWLTLELS